MIEQEELSATVKEEIGRILCSLANMQFEIAKRLLARTTQPNYAGMTISAIVMNHVAYDLHESLESHLTALVTTLNTAKEAGIEIDNFGLEGYLSQEVRNQSRVLVEDAHAKMVAVEKGLQSLLAQLDGV